MKLLKTIALIILLPLAVLAQDQKDISVQEGTLKMGKKKMPCFYAAFPYDKGPTIDGIEYYIQRDNIKRSARKKGVSIYRGAEWALFANTRNDYYYKVKSKKGKTIVYFAMSKGYDNYVTLANDPTTANSIAMFLKKLNGQIFNTLLIQKKEAELKTMESKNEAAAKDLKDAKNQQAEKTKEIQQLKRHDAPNPTR